MGNNVPKGKHTKNKNDLRHTFEAVFGNFLYYIARYLEHKYGIKCGLKKVASRLYVQALDSAL